MDRMAWYQKQYDLEWVHRAHLFDLTKFCILATTVLGTAIAAAAHSFNYAAQPWIVWPFGALLALSALSLLIGLFHIRGSLLDQWYSYPPKAGELESDFARITQWVEDHGGDSSPEDLLGEDLHARIVAAADVNFETNRARASRIQRALRWLARSLVPLFGAALLYIASFYSLS